MSSVGLAYMYICRFRSTSNSLSPILFTKISNGQQCSHFSWNSATVLLNFKKKC